MVFIKKLEMKGFKSFGNEKVTLNLPEGFTSIVGPNGSGKCVVGDTLVHLADGSFPKIRDIVNQKLKSTNVKKLDDGYMIVGDGTEVLSLDLSELKIRKRKIQAYIKRKSPKKLIQIKTRSGREIISTIYHPLFILKENRVVSVNAEELREGQRIAVPKIFPVFENKNVTSDIYWDEINTIKEIISKEEWVYDLCINEDHNFLANNIIIHNSNILDAFCFVLGHLSAKTLRAGALSDLIYKAENDRNSSKYTTVTLNLDNSDHGIQVDSKNVIITRTIDEDGKGTYLLNGKRVTRSQILDILSIAGISPDGYNIVLQGQLAQMISMTPLERRNLLEKIAGITAYDEKKEKAKTELDRANSNLSQIEVLIDEVKKAKEKLLKDKEDAEKWLNLSQEIEKLEASILFQEINAIKSKKEEAKKRLEERQEKLKEFDKDFKDKNEKKKNFQDKANQIEEDINQIRENEFNKINQDIIENKSIYSKIISDLKYQEQSFNHANKQLEKLNLELEEYSKMKIEHESDLKEGLIIRKNLNEEIESSNEEINQISNSISNIDSDFEDLATEFRNSKSVLEQKENELNKLIIENEKNDTEINALKDKINSIEELTNETISGSKNIIDQKETLSNKINELKNKLESLSNLNVESLENIEHYSERIKNISSDIQIKKEILIETRARINAIKEGGGRASNRLKAIESILELKKQNQIEGIFGTISDLGVVKSENIKALEVAAGGRLDYLIVEDEDIAARCIAFLKSKKLGRASFLPLNNLEPSIIEVKNKIAKAALEMVKFEEKFRKAFEFVFGKTYVFENLEKAMQFKDSRIRKVSIDGDLIEPSGLMVGGYYQSLSKFTVEEEQRLPIMIKEINALNEELNQLKIKRDNELKRKSELEIEIQKNEKNFNLFLGQLNGIEPQLKELEISISSGKEKINKITPILVEKEKRKSNLENNISEIEENISQLRNNYEKASKKLERTETVKLNRKLKEIDEQRTLKISSLRELDQKITQLQTEINAKINPSMEEINKSIENLNKQIPNLAMEVEKNKKSASDINQKLENLDSENAKINNKLNKLQYEKKDLNKQVDNLIFEISNIDKEINSLNLGIARMTANQETFALQLQDLLNRAKEYKTDQKELEKDLDVDEVRNQIQDLKIERNSLEPVNQKAIQEFEGVKKRFDELNSRKLKLYAERESILQFMDEIEREKTKVFMKTYRAIDDNFNKIFSRLSQGGEAHLDLEDKIHPFLGGVRIKAKPSGKEISYLESMSGGEKALTALALIFAIQQYQPAPFYILDEIDAALDLSNVVKVAELIKEFSKYSQFIIITLRDIMMARADCLFGVTRSNDSSKVVSVKLEEVGKYIE